MNGSPQDLDRALLAVPTPIAAPALNCLLVNTRAEAAAALSFLRRSMLGFLHAAAFARLRELPPGTHPAFSFARPVLWGDPESVLRLHAGLGELPNEPKGVWASGPLWPAYLAECEELFQNAGAGQGDLAGASSWRPQLEGCLGELLGKALHFCHGWELLHGPNSFSDRGPLLLRGPLPQWMKHSPAQRGEPGMQLRAGRNCFSLEPWIWWGPPAMGSIPGALESTRGLLHVTISAGPEQAVVCYPEMGISLARNDLAASLSQPLRRRAESGSLRSRAWGVILLRVLRMRNLNTRYGFAAGDRLLGAMDAAASRFRSEKGGIPGALALFPFWRHGGELVAPFYCDAALPAHVVASLACEAASEVASAAHAAAPGAKSGLKLSIGIRLRVTLTGGRDENPERFSQQIMAATQELKSASAPATLDPGAGVIWRLEWPATNPMSRCDPAFTRTSSAVFGLIQRQAPQGGREWLLRLNRRHGAFNFIGGHLEPEDADLPERGLARELAEELEIPRGSFRAIPLFAAPLHHVAYSAPHAASTCYFHHFYLLESCPQGVLDDPEKLECRWFPADAFTEPFADEVSRHPLIDLRRFWNFHEARAAGEIAPQSLLGFSPAPMGSPLS